MTSPSDEAAEISAQIIRSIQQQLASVLHNQLLASGTLIKPTLHLEGVIHEGWEGAANARAVSRRIDLVSFIPCTPAATPLLSRAGG